MEQLRWFEGVCHQLNSNPQEATRIINEFQDNKEAYELSRYFFDGTNNEQSQYQALSILQHSFLKFSFQDEEIKEFLWSRILSKERVYPPSVYQKLILVYVVVWKQLWITHTPQQRSLLFENISIFINQNLDNPINLMIAARILRTILEVFSRKSSGSEMRLFSPKTNLSVHSIFQSDKEFCGLAATYTLSLTLLSRIFDGIPDSLLILQVKNLSTLRIDIAEFSSQTCHLLVELLSWDFKLDTAIGNEESKMLLQGYEQISVKLPADWVAIAGGPDAFQYMLKSSISCYLKLRNTNLLNFDGALSIYFDASNALVTSKAIKEYFFSFRQLLLCLASIASSNSAAFPSNEAKISYITIFFESISSILKNNSVTSDCGPRPRISPFIHDDYFLELRYQEFEHIIFITIRLLGNFHLEVVGKSSAFSDFLMSLSEITLELANNIIVTINSPNHTRENEFESILESWRGDALTQLLDLWAMILDDSIMQRPDDMISTNFVNELRNNLSDIAATIFARLFDALLLVSIKDAISCEDEELDEEAEEIGQRSIDDLIDGIALIGRSLSLWHSLNHVKLSLSRALNDANMLYQPLLADNLPHVNLNELEIHDKVNRIRILEIQRLSIVFFRSLLLEGSGLSSKIFGSSTDSSQIQSSSSEIPVIPRYFVNSIKNNNNNNNNFLRISNIVQEVVQETAKCVDSQRNLLKLCSNYGSSNLPIFKKGAEYLTLLVSPLIMRSSFEFFADFIRTYSGADATLYEDPDIATNIKLLCGSSPLTSYLSINDQPTLFTLLVSGMLNCSIECIYNMGAEDLLCLSAIRLIHNIALYLSHQDIFLLITSRNETILQLWHIFSTISNEATENYFKLTHLFSPIVLTNLWEAISSLTTRLLTHSIINMITNIGQSGLWIIEQQYLSVFQQMTLFLQSLLQQSNCFSDLRKVIACLRGICRVRYPKPSIDYLQDEIINYFKSQLNNNINNNDNNNDNEIDFRPQADEHIQKLESFHQSQIGYITGLFDTHLEYIIHNLTNVSLADDIDYEILKELIVMMSDYTEKLFPQLSSQSILKFFEAFLKCIVIITPKLNGNNSLHINFIISVLNLLDILTTQEFCVPPVTISQYFLGTNYMIGQEIQISDIVSVLLLLISQVWSLEILEYYTDLQKAYFSLLIYTLSSSSEFLVVSQNNLSLIKLFQSIGLNEEQILQLLNKIYSTLIWGVTSIYPSTPRVALQGIQHCALVGIKSNGSNDLYFDLLTQFLFHCQESFTLLIGNEFNSAKYGDNFSSSPIIISKPSTPLIGKDNNNNNNSIMINKTKSSFLWERADSFSSTYLSVIAFNVERFLTVVIPEYLTHRFPDNPSQNPLAQLFHNLVTDKNINLSDYRKQNCRIFSENITNFLKSC